MIVTMLHWLIYYSGDRTGLYRTQMAVMALQALWLWLWLVSLYVIIGKISTPFLCPTTVLFWSFPWPTAAKYSR